MLHFSLFLASLQQCVCLSSFHMKGNANLALAEEGLGFLSSSELLFCTDFLERLSTSLPPQKLSFLGTEEPSQCAWLLSVPQDVSFLAHQCEDHGEVLPLCWYRGQVHGEHSVPELGVWGSTLHTHSLPMSLAVEVVSPFQKLGWYSGMNPLSAYVWVNIKIN